LFRVVLVELIVVHGVPPEWAVRVWLRSTQTVQLSG
jgi:hypothetical protein